jgi:hypothetical protein
MTLAVEETPHSSIISYNSPFPSWDKIPFRHLRLSVRRSGPTITAQSGLKKLDSFHDGKVREVVAMCRHLFIARQGNVWRVISVIARQRRHRAVPGPLSGGLTPLHRKGGDIAFIYLPQMRQSLPHVDPRRLQSAGVTWI